RFLPAQQGPGLHAEDRMKTSQLARAAQVNIETVRYYERSGLLPEPKRRQSGYREFSEQDLQRLKFIRRAQELGFSLREIKELLSLRADPGADRAEVKELAESKINDIEQRIRDLMRLKATLQDLSNLCDGHGTTEDCPILHVIDGSLDLNLIFSNERNSHMSKAHTETLTIEGMSCGHCVRAVEKSLKNVTGVEVHRVAVGSAEISYDPAQVSRETLAQAIDDAGFELK
ncbi:MAG TPA: MerR family DNA-binding protein, partial [Acidobacteriota bacterium]|nr:MerR family DNA-binding protein [Acidobacteriota bacterium]